MNASLINRSNHCITCRKKDVVAFLFSSMSEEIRDGLFAFFILNSAKELNVFENRLKKLPSEQRLDMNVGTKFYLVLLTEGLKSFVDLPYLESLSNGRGRQNQENFLKVDHSVHSLPDDEGNVWTNSDPRVGLKVLVHTCVYFIIDIFDNSLCLLIKVSGIPASYTEHDILKEMHSRVEFLHISFFMPLKFANGIITSEHMGYFYIQMMSVEYVKPFISTFDGYRLLRDQNAQLKVEYHEPLLNESIGVSSVSHVECDYDDKMKIDDDEDDIDIFSTVPSKAMNNNTVTAKQEPLHNNLHGSTSALSIGASVGARGIDIRPAWMTKMSEVLEHPLYHLMNVESVLNIMIFTNTSSRILPCPQPTLLLQIWRLLNVGMKTLTYFPLFLAKP